MAMTEPSRIILVISGRLFRDSIDLLLEATDRTIVGSFDNLDQFEAAFKTLPHPVNLVIALISEQAEKDLDCVRTLRSKMSSTRWILLSRRWTLETTHQALRIGVESLLLEDCNCEVLKLVVELVGLGQSFIPLELALYGSAGGYEGQTVPRSGGCERNMPAIAVCRNMSSEAAAAVEPIASPEHEVIRFPRDAENAAATAGFSNGGRLSDRQEQILECLALGYSNKLIARNLEIAEATVKVHVKALLRKMQVSNRTQAAISASNFLGFSKRLNRTPTVSGSVHTVPRVAVESIDKTTALRRPASF